jgi:hypothetical protein
MTPITTQSGTQAVIVKTPTVEGELTLLSPLMDDEEMVTRITPIAYLRSVWAVIRGAFLHPLSTTVIDLSTGEYVIIHTTTRNTEDCGR